MLATMSDSSIRDIICLDAVNTVTITVIESNTVEKHKKRNEVGSQI